MDQNVDFSVLANFQGCLDEPGDLFEVHDTRLAENGLGSHLLDLLSYFLCTLSTAFGDIVDNHVGTSLSKLQGNASTDTTKSKLAIDHVSRKWMGKRTEKHR